MKVTYRVTARRAGDWWALEVPELPGVFSQTKRLDKADEQISEAIAVMLDVEPSEFSVRIEPVLPAAAQKALQQAIKARKDAEKASEAEREALRHAAAVLAKDLSQRDTGRVMGLSFQRVSQLLKAYPGQRSSRAGGRAAPRERAAS